jgi:energy-coupling factor transporter ATP-binding protein EcfA2
MDIPTNLGLPTHVESGGEEQRTVIASTIICNKGQFP